MTQADKLEALVQRARSNGWDMAAYADWAQGATHLVHGTNWYALTFNHDFARALFGEKPEYEMDLYSPDNYQLNLNCWEWHLQQAVISDDPIDYMYSVVFLSRWSPSDNF